MIDTLAQDLRYALRSYRKAPAFAAGVIATIGLGLGFVCSAFTVVNGYLLKPFDLRDPDALYELTWDTSAVRWHQLTIDDWSALQTSQPVLSSVAAFTGTEISVEDGTIYGQLVTGNYFETLGLRMWLGRPIGPQDATRPGDRPVAVLTYAAWLGRYGADPSIVGRDIRLGRSQFTVVGVAQPGFAGFGDTPISFFVPLTMAAEFPMRDPYSAERPAMLNAVARLGAGTTVDAAKAWFTVWLKQRLADAGPEEMPTIARVEPRGRRIPLTPRTIAFFTSVVVAFGLVLLIACANVANMMLARGLSRQQEMAVRLSLGATRARVVRQLLVEALFCAIPAAMLGYGITYVSALMFPRLIVETWPEALLPVESLIAPMEPDGRVIAFVVVAAALAALVFGLSPALQTTNTSLSRASRGEFGTRLRTSRLRSGLVVAQVAASVLFLVTASQLLGELDRMSGLVQNIHVDRIADLRVSREYRSAVVERLQADPRVGAVAAIWRPPFYGPLRKLEVAPGESNKAMSAGFMVVSPEYFQVLEIPIVRGRPFSRTEADAQADVAIVSEATARRLWPSEDAMGQTLRIVTPPRGGGMRRPAQSMVRIIGVARDSISGSILDGIDWTCIYFPTSPSVNEDVALLLQAQTTMASLRDAVTDARVAVRRDASFPFYPMRQVIGVQEWAMWMASAIVALLAAGALLLAFSGTYSVVAFLVSERTREFGIRMALGATVAAVVRSVIRESLRLGTGGLIVGGALALGLSVALGSAIEIGPALTIRPYLIGGSIVLLASAIAAAVPSLRASRVAPAVALRTE
jgi:predicted permease